MDPGTKPKEFYRDKNGMHPLFVLPADVAEVAADLDDLAGVGRTTETVKGNADAIANLAGAGRTTETVVNSVQKTGDQSMAGPLEITQPGSKYYSPVSGESSLGTPHPHYYQFITAGGPIGPMTIDYDLNALGQMPTNAKAAWIVGYCASAAANDSVWIRNTADQRYGVGFNNVAGLTMGVQGLVIFNGDYKVRMVWAGTGNFSAINFWMTAYWI